MKSCQGNQIFEARKLPDKLDLGFSNAACTFSILYQLYNL